jgi:hypothetical protein
MPIYEYQGQQYDIATDDQAAAKQKILDHLELQKTQPQPDSLGRYVADSSQTAPQEGPKQVDENAPDFTRGLTNELGSLQNVYGGAKVLAGKVLGSQSLMQSGLESMKAGEAKTEVKPTDDLTDAFKKGIGSVVGDWLPYQIGSGVGNILETLGFMGIGAGVGALTGAGAGALPGAVAGAVEKSLIKKGVQLAAENVLKETLAKELAAGTEKAAAKEVAKTAAEKYVAEHAIDMLAQIDAKAAAQSAARNIGGNLGIVSQAGLHGAGEVTGQAVQQAEAEGRAPTDINMTRVVPAALVHGVADFFAEKIGLHALDGMALNSSGKMVQDIAKAIALTGTKEAVPETIQEIAQRYGANMSLTDADALKDYLNTVGASYAMSVVPAGIGGVRANLAHRVAEISDQTNTLQDSLATKVATAPGLLDANGKPIVAPDQTETTLSAASPQESIYDAPKKEAADYLAKIDSGEVQPNASILKKHLAATGAEMPETGKGFRDRALEALKTHLAPQGEQNVGTTSTVDGTDRSSAEVLGQQTDSTATTGTTTVGDQGLGRVTPPANMPQAGKGTERTALKQQSTTMPTRPLPLKEESQTITPIESQAALEKDQAQAAQDEAARQAALKETIGQNIPQTKTDESIREEYELSRQAQKEAGVVIPAWEDLKADEKDTYLGSLKTNPSAEDFDNAAKTLAAYREQNKGSGLKPTEQRIVNGYEENRPIFQRSLGIDIPAWGSLSPEAQSAYTSKVKTNSPVEQGAGFTAVAEQLEQEGHGIRNVSREGVRNLKLKGTEEVSKAAATERIKKEAAEEASAQGKGEALSENTKAKLIAGDINGVLSDLISSSEGFKGLNLKKGDKTYRQAYAYLASIRKRASALTFRLLATSLNTLTFNSKVITDPNNKVIQRLEQEGKLAEYNPKTDTFYFTPGGFDESTVLHEIVHAGTVKIISQYLKDPSKLTQTQRDAAEHLQKIYDFSKKRLGSRFKNAYENLYEFVSYAMTDNKFQIALAETQVRPLAKYTAKAMAAWKQFTQALSKMFGLYDAKAQTEELTAEMYAQVAKEYGSMDPDELYETIKDAETVGEFATSMLNEEGNEKEVVVKKEKIHATQARKFLTTYPGYEGNLMLEMSEVFSRILASPEKGIKVAPLAVKKAETKMDNGSILPSKDKPGSITKEQQPRNIKYFKDLLFTRQGWRRIATAVQNDRYEVKHWQDMRDLAGQIYYEGKDKINNVYGQLARAPAQGMNLYRSLIEGTYEKLDKSISDLSKATGFNIKDTLELLHNVAVGMHDYERRLVKYLKIVPLSEKKNLKYNGKMISAADFRKMAFEKLNDNKTTEAEARQLRHELDAIVFTKNTKGEFQPNTKYVSELGDSPRQVTDKGGVRKGVNTELDNPIYDVSLLTYKEAQQRMDEYHKFQHKGLVDTALQQVRELHHTTTELNKMANYWSQPVSNHVAFYGWDNYVPLAGYHSEEDEGLNLNGKHMGRELQDMAHSFEGRVSESNNTILQSMTDAVRSAMRAGRKDLTQSIKNASKYDKKLNPNGTGILPTAKVWGRITFEERRNKEVVDSLPRENTIFHYNEDGSIDIIEIADNKLRESIRRSFKDTNPLVTMANNITSRLGMMHTRYNFNFAPLNFVRDALTNAWAIGAQLGPLQSAKYIADIATKVTTQNSLGKALKVAALYESKDYNQIKILAAKDPIIKDMYDFVEKGGMVDYLQGLSLKSNFQRLHKELGRSGVIKNVTQLNRFVDIWTDMFELSSRSAAYAIAKQNFKSRGLSEEAATTKAVEYAKNLANFEQVGQYGKELGAVFMFFRPSATGAVRAIEAVAPAFQNVKSALRDLPPGTSEEAIATFKTNFAEHQKNARYMTAALMGLGALAYTMSSMMAGDDDLGRNKVANDDPAQWTRFARFFTPFSDNPIQLPWGFGLGSFAAAGAQLAAVGSGHQSFGGAMGNILTQISLDSFVPIPVSRMPIQDNPALWMLDSLTPSMLRPAMEFVVNKNGLGQSIYSDANRRMGDAYLGGNNIPEIYKTIARQLFDSSAGAIDFSPNSIYFLANSYMDGPARIIESTTNGMYLASGQAEEKDAIARMKGTPFIGSFIGSAPNVDSREFSSIENQIKDKQKIYTQAQLNPEVEAKYVDKNPLDPEIIDYYNHVVNGRLKELRSQANQIKLMQGVSPKDRASMLKEINKEQNLVKYDLVQQFKSYGMKP